jgi:hypothetical protein
MQLGAVVHNLALIAASSLCPDCPPARAARALVLGDEIWTNLLWVVLPFVVIALVVGWLSRYALRYIDRGSRRG